jgi:hypothetical protein
MNKTPKNLPILHIHEWTYKTIRKHAFRKCKSCPVLERINMWGMPIGSYPSHIKTKHQRAISG